MTDELSTMWLELVGHGVKENYYDAGGVRTRALEAGAGGALILLHGTGGHAETYHRNLGRLGQRHHVYAIDMLGHGFTDRPDVDYSMDDFTDHVIRFMDAAGIESAAISGESLGAMVAAWASVKHPERVSHAVLNTGILARPDAKGLSELADLETRTAALAANLTRESVRQRMEWLVLDPNDMTDELVECRYRIYSQPGMLDSVQKIMSSVQRMIRGDWPVDYFAPSVLEGIKCPCLVLWTTHNPGQSKELAQSVMGDIPQATFQLLEDCAHWPQFESAEHFNRLHEDFLG
ncbi:MAG: alpha/beta fold hydrolase [Micromonosporaceae bacterium]